MKAKGIPHLGAGAKGSLKEGQHGMPSKGVREIVHVKTVKYAARDKARVEWKRHGGCNGATELWLVELTPLLITSRSLALAGALDISNDLFTTLAALTLLLSPRLAAPLDALTCSSAQPTRRASSAANHKLRWRYVVVIACKG